MSTRLAPSDLRRLARRAAQRNARRAGVLAAQLDVNADNLADIRAERVRKGARTRVAHPNLAQGLDHEQRLYEQVKRDILGDLRAVARESEASSFDDRWPGR